VDDVGPLVFISYQGQDGLAYAIKAKRILIGCGCRAWVWEDDHASPGDVQLEMVDNIEACHYFLDICTSGSAESRGQEYERLQAWKYDKIPPVILAFNDSFIPRRWGGYDRYLVSEDTFAGKCQRVGDDLRHQQRLVNRAVDDEPATGGVRLPAKIAEPEGESD